MNCKSFRKNMSCYRIFLIVTALNFCVSLIYLICTRGEVLDQYVAFRGADHYMDFFNHIRYVENPQETYFVTKHACFPPLAYVFYLILNRILPVSQATGTTAEYIQPYALLLFVIYISILTVLLFYCLAKIMKKHSLPKVLILTLAALVSNVYVFWIAERGNAAYIVAVLLLAFYILKDSDKKYQRELALILLATAACFKIYPAFFGLVYLVEKRYKEAVRLVIYALLLFFLPFVFFGGLDGVIQFFKNQFAIQGGEYVGITSIYAACRFFIKNLKIALPVYITLFVIFAASGISIICTSTIDKYKKYFLICALMLFLPPWNGGYTCAYLLLPFAIFMEENNEKLSDHIFAIMFGVIFSLMTYNFNVKQLCIGEFFIFSTIYIMTAVFIVQGFISIAHKKNEKFSR